MLDNLCTLARVEKHRPHHIQTVVLSPKDSIKLKFASGLHPWHKTGESLVEETHNMPRSTHPAGEIMDYLHMQLHLRKMNEEHLAEGRMWEGFRHLAPVTQTWGCVEESEMDVVLGRNTKKLKLALASHRFQLFVCPNFALVPPGRAWGVYRPPATLISHRLNRSLHLQE